MTHLLRLLAVSIGLLAGQVALAGHPVPVASADAPALAQRLASAHWIAEGVPKPAHILYVFLDPSCPYCNALWKQIAAAKRQDLQVRYLLVAVISDDSRDKAAAILEAPRPALALARHEAAFEGGGLAPHAPTQSTTGEIIAANEQLMSDLHIRGTPGAAWLETGADLQVFTGMPDGTQLARMLGGGEAGAK